MVGEGDRSGVLGRNDIFQRSVALSWRKHSRGNRPATPSYGLGDRYGRMAG